MATFTGTADADTWSGASEDDLAYGLAGDDSLLGGDGDDVLEGGAGADTLDGGSGSDTASYAGATSAVTVDVSNFANNTGDAAGDSYASIEVFRGSAYGDTFISSTGVNTNFQGGTGNDAYTVDSVSDTITESVGEGIDTVSTTLSAYTLAANLEGLTFTGSGAFTGTGNAGANLITGGGGDDVLEGGAGADTLDGGSGTDTASYAGATSAVTVDVSNFANNTGDAAGDSYISIEVFRGSAYGDTFISATGVNTNFQGGAGNDAYTVDSVSDTITEGMGEGVDTVSTTLNAYTLAANLEGLTFTGSGAFTGTGNAGANAITGGAGDDVLIGGDGADTLDGAGGVNTASYVNATGGVAVSLANPGTNTGEAAGDTFANIQNLTGGGFADNLTGDSQGNLLTGGGGDDVLEGGAGADTLDGGSGSDTASYAGATSAVTVDVSNFANNTGDATGDSYASIEVFRGSAYGDTFISATGVNTNFQGGAGNDAYTVDSVSDTITEGVGEGVDTVSTTLNAYTLAANLEGLTFTGSGAFTGTGNAGANFITGGAANDTLVGGDGADALDGAGGVNTASYVNATGGVAVSLANPGTNTGEAAGDTYANIQNLTGGGFADTLTGDSQGNLLSGGGGADVLEGGAGADTLDGGSGTDTVSYAGANSALVIDVSNFANNTGDATGDSYTSIEVFRGSVYGDTFISSTGVNTNFQGGAGNDSYTVDSASDTITEGVGEGVDTVSTTVTTYTLAANLEGLTFTGSGAFTGAGNAGANAITGGSGDDVLIGGDGGDALNGAGGVNTASYLNATAGVAVSLANPGTNTGEAAGDTYANIQNLTGGGFADTLTGDSQNNVLNGGGGADQLDGAGGVNAASYANSAGGVLVNLASPAANSGEAAGDTYVNIQNLAGGAYADTLIGDALGNSLSGAGGDDILIGGAGADSLDGGAGNNTASYATASSLVVVTLGGTLSAGDASGDTFTNVQNLTGSAYDDALFGDAQNNILMGGAGADVLEGGGGVDTASYANAGTGLIANLTTRTLNTGDAAGDTYTAIRNLTGSAYADSLTGDTQNNALSGGGGNDLLYGGAGADALDGGGGVNTASYSAATVAVSANLTNSASNVGDAAGDTYANIQNLTGTNFADTLVGDGQANVLIGGNGNDLMEGGAGADSLDGGVGSDTISYATAGGGVNVDLGNVANNTGDAAGDSYNQVEAFVGSAFNDTFTTVAGTTTFRGGAGNDSYYVGSAANTVTENAGEGTDTVFTTAGSYTLGVNVEGLAFVGSGDFLGTGNAVNNTITGGGGNDTLIGGAGADVLDGGLGINTASYANDAAVYASLANPSANTGAAAGDTYTNIQNLVGGQGPDTLIGDFHDNTLNGANGNDFFIGGGGADSFVGGASLNGDFDDVVSYATGSVGVNVDFQNTANNTGEAAGDNYYAVEVFLGSNYNDTFSSVTSANFNTKLRGGLGDDQYYVDNGNDIVTENAGEGVDRVYSTSTAYTITANIEALTFVGTGDFSGTGNAGANTLTGGAGNDTLAGGAGADVLDGGGGINTASYGNDTAVLASLANPSANTGAAAGDTYTNIQNLVGGQGTDTLIGDFHDNTLNGANGNDLFIGGGGADSFVGGASLNGDFDDVVSYATGSVGVNVDFQNTANNTGEAAGDNYYAVEVFVGSNYNDTFSSITSAAFNTKLRGGLGDDRYYVDGGNDIVTENAGEGNDTVYTTTSAYTITANVEGLTFIGSGDFSATGNAGANVLTGGAGNDTLYGGGGADVLDGGTGGFNSATYANDAAVLVNLGNLSANTGAAAGDTYVNIQNVTGSGQADTLIGDSLNNDLVGGAGNDLLVGGGGADTLTGGLGSDIFDLNALTESTIAAPDLIADLATGDKIDVSTLDADTTVAGDQAFHLDGTFGSAGDIVFYFSGALGCTVVNLYVDNDATVDATFWIGGNVTLTASNFIL